MALQKVFTREDGSIGNYMRLVMATLPNYDKDRGLSVGSLGFDIYINEEAAKIDNKAPFLSINYPISSELLKALDLSNDWNTVAASVYKNRNLIAGLEDATDILDGI